MLVYRRLLFLCLGKVPRPGLNAEASVLNMRPRRLQFPEKTFLIIIMREKFQVFFQYADIGLSCADIIGVGFGFMIGWFKLTDIIGGWRIFRLYGGVTAIMLLAIRELLNRRKNNKMERETEDYESS